MANGTNAAVPEALRQFFREHPRVALAFSGGTDSAYLLYAATACGCEVRAYYARSAFQPAFERADARRLAEQLSAELREIPLDVLAVEAVRRNPADRCYHCKRAIFSALLREARADGFDVVIDGTNASDDAGDRPGMRALRELRVLSPLRLCGIPKAEVRALSRQAGLFTWDKPAYACLATRVPAGVEITDPRYDKIFSLLDERGMFAVTHAGPDPVSPGRVFAPPEGILTVLRRHPALTLVAAHLGGPGTAKEVLRLLVGTGVYFDTSLSSTRDAEREDLYEILRRHDPRRLLFGTDTPWTDPATEIRFLENSGLPKADLNLIFYRNARRLLGADGEGETT